MVRVKDDAELELYIKRTTQPAKKQPVMDHVPGPAEVLALQLKDVGVTFLYDSFHFHPSRNYRADFAIPQKKPWLIIECDGGTFMKGGGGHNRGKDYENDRERDAEALLLGFTVLRVTPRQILEGKAISWITQLYNKGQGNGRTF